MKIYTRTGDDGTTALFFGGRVRKDHPRPAALGSVDELQAALGLVRAHLTGEDDLASLVLQIERELYVAMAELATMPDNRHKLKPGVSAITSAMPERLENLIDDYSARFDPPTEFVLPGGTVVAALLDVARTAARRAERACVGIEESGEVVRYLNRLSDLLWVLARWQEGVSAPAKPPPIEQP
ncbi:MAG: cob(I)yrinic acid a,c-diamide adenosyltransferase [Actinomycetota bacterium]